MGHIKTPQKALPFIGILFTPGVSLNPVIHALKDEMGEHILQSEAIDFKHTTYYTEEMGEIIRRQWYVFNDLVDPSQITRFKQTTNALENQHLDHHNNRQINIDPGLITMSNVILASTKNYSHRIYLGQGIYAEVTLMFKDKQYRALEWTYPDYRETATRDFFKRARDLLKEKLVQDPAQ